MAVVALLLGLDNSAQAVKLQAKSVNEYFLSEDYLQTAANNEPFADGIQDDEEDLVQLEKKSKKHTKHHRGIRAQVASESQHKSKVKAKKTLMDAKKSIAKQQGISLGLLLAIENYDKQVGELKDVRDYLHKILGELKNAKDDLKNSISQKAEDAAREDIEMLESGLPASQKDLNQAEADVNDASHRILAESKSFKSQAINYEGVFEEMKKSIDDLKTTQLEQLDKVKAAKKASGAHNKDIAQDSADRAAIFVQLAKNMFEAADKQLHTFQQDEIANGLSDDPEVKSTVMESEENMKKYLEELNGIMEDAEDDVKESRAGADTDICKSSKLGKERIEADYACNLLQLELTKLDMTLFTARRRLEDFEKGSKCTITGKKTVCEKREEVAEETTAETVEKIEAIKAKKDGKTDKKEKADAKLDVKADAERMNKKIADAEAKDKKEIAKPVEKKKDEKIVDAKKVEEEAKPADEKKDEQKVDAEKKEETKPAEEEKKTGLFKIMQADDEAEKLRSSIRTKQGELSSLEEKLRALRNTEDKAEDVQKKRESSEVARTVSGDRMKLQNSGEGHVASKATEHTRRAAGMAPLDRSDAPSKTAKVFDEKKQTIDDNGKESKNSDDEESDKKGDSPMSEGIKKNIKEESESTEESMKEVEKTGDDVEKTNDDLGENDKKPVEIKKKPCKKNKGKKLPANADADVVGDIEGESGEAPTADKEEEAPAKKDEGAKDEQPKEESKDKKEEEKPAEKTEEKKDDKPEEKKDEKKEDKKEEDDLTEEQKSADEYEKKQADKKKAKAEEAKKAVDAKKEEAKKSKDAKDKIKKDKEEEIEAAKNAEKAHAEDMKKEKEEEKKAKEEEKKKLADEQKKIDEERKQKAEDLKKAAADKKKAAAADAAKPAAPVADAKKPAAEPKKEEKKEEVAKPAADAAKVEKKDEAKPALADSKLSLNVKVETAQDSAKNDKVSADLFAQKNEPTEATLVQLQELEYPQPDIRGPMPQNAHPDSTFSSHVHNDWTYLQQHADLVDYPSPEQRGESMAQKQSYEGEYIEDKRMFAFEMPGDY